MRSLQYNEDMSVPQISIIVPVYNAEKYLRKCIDSILDQTFTDFEVILIDDGSSDQSGLICDEYLKKDARVRVLHKKNDGVSNARNTGILSSRGKWITFIDSDDYIGHSYLYDFGIEKYSADFYLQGYHVECNASLISRHLFPINGISMIPFDKLFIIGESENILNSPVCKLFNRDIILKYRLLFDVNTSYGEDHLFVLSYLLNAQSFVVSSAGSYCYVKYFGPSLTRRSLPIDEIVYYTIKTNVMQKSLLKKAVCNSNSLDVVINRRTYSNMLTGIKNLIGNKENGLDEYNVMRFSFRKLKNGYIGLTIFQIILQFIFYYLPSRFSYVFFLLYTRMR